jgi:hypothetical protein
VSALPWNESQVSSGIRAYRVKIRELDVSNGPESGRNLAVISVLKMTALCHLRHSRRQKSINIDLLKTAGIAHYATY